MAASLCAHRMGVADDARAAPATTGGVLSSASVDALARRPVITMQHQAKQADSRSAHASPPILLRKINYLPVAAEC
jgi:hypothetical protein